MITSDTHSLNTYDYELPEDLIAQVPHEPADECRFLVYEKWNIADTIFSSLPSLLDPKKHILFFNESKVLRARVPLKNAVSRTKFGSEKVFDGEIFYLKPFDSCHSESAAADEESLVDDSCVRDPSFHSGWQNNFIAMVYPWDRFPVWWTVTFQGIEIFVEETVYEGRILSIKSDISVNEFLEKYGQMPLPPYVEYTPEKEVGYQPVFAMKEWSVASPTASLHFTQRLLDELTEKCFWQEKIVLHVGLWTFKNIYEEDIRQFDMHVEMAEVTRELFEKIAQYKKNGKIILAVGTTVSRTLESLPFLWSLIKENFTWSDECVNFWNVHEKSNSSIIPSFSIDWESINFESKIFIYPGFELTIIDELITNFHLPKSTLLMLVSAFAGIEEIKKIYTHAREQKYRFFSFWDAMYLRN